MTFIENYLKYVEKTEQHHTYTLFSCLTCLSAIVGRKVWLDLGAFQIWPNLYTVLVGPPAARKSSSIFLMADVLRLIRDNSDDIPIASEAITKEKLVIDVEEQERRIPNVPPQYKMHDTYAPMTILASELSQFLGTASLNMVDFLTDVYDRPDYDSRTKNKGDVFITGPYITLIAGTTPSWITTYLKEDIITGGFSRRCLFILEDGPPKRIAFPELDKEARQACIDYGKKLKKVFGPMELAPEAKEFYGAWYEKYHIPEDETISGYYGSKHVQMLKIAQLISLSESTELKFEKRHMEFALGILDLIEQKLPDVFKSVGRNDLNAAAVKIEGLLRRAPKHQFKLSDGTIKEAHALARNRLSAMTFRDIRSDEFDSVIAHMKQVGKISTATTNIKGKSVFLIILESESSVK